jgi:hypothetical protein
MRVILGPIRCMIGAYYAALSSTASTMMGEAGMRFDHFSSALSSGGRADACEAFVRNGLLKFSAATPRCYDML